MRMDSYQVEITDGARREIRSLPGHLRQRVIRALRDLSVAPRPPGSRPLTIEKAGMVLPLEVELQRLRIDAWRIIYLIDDGSALITVLGVRRRPPYQYEDLKLLISDL